MDKTTFNETVNRGLERIIFEGESGHPQNYVIFELSNEAYYFQILGARGDFSVLCESVGNGFMISDDHISEVQIEQLMKLGWSDAIGESNHTIQLSCESISDRNKLAELFYETAAIYKCDAISLVEVHIG